MSENWFTRVWHAVTGGEPPASSASPAPAAPKRGVRMYGAARSNRLTVGAGANHTSEDAELQSSLPTMRSRARQMVRDSSYARRAKKVVVTNVIGGGIKLQAMVGVNRGGTLNTRVNDDIESAHARWAKAGSCHTGGKLGLSAMERLLMGEVFEAGEVLVRLHERRFGDSAVPLALEVVESERLAQDGMPLPVETGNEVRMGVEVDSYQRPVAYWIRRRHPGDLRLRVSDRSSDEYERVPARDVMHLHLVERWPQTRGRPWMHTGMRKLDDMNEYTALELLAARGGAAYFATIESEADGVLADESEEDGSQVMTMEPLTIQGLNPGEKLQFHSPDRPNTALDPFMRAMLREIAAGMDVSYESLSRDYSQSNYSSSRLALLDDRELFRALQQWWIDAFRDPLYARWLTLAVAAGAVSSIPRVAFFADAGKYTAVRFKPRGWGWIDPTKEVQAYKEAVKAGFTTISDVIAATGNGQDIEDIVQTAKRDKEMFEAAGLFSDCFVSATPATPAPATGPSEGRELEDRLDELERRVAPGNTPVIPLRKAT